MTISRTFVVLLLPVVLTAGLSLFAAEGGQPPLDPDLPYQAKKANPVTYDVDFRAIVTAPYKTKSLKVWLPLPQSDAGQEVTEGEISTFPLNVTPKIGKEPLYGNQFAYFELDQPEGAQIIRHTFKVKVWELRWDVDPDKVAAMSRWPDGFDRYLRSEQMAVVVDDRFRKLADEIVPRRRGPASDLAGVMTWANERFKYDHANASLRASSEHALTNRAGHCSDYHGFCAAVGRAMGYPTRVTYGINSFAKNSPSHCKLEAFLPGYGWVSFDVSDTQKLIAEIKKDPNLDAAKKDALARAANERLLRGFRDNTWFAQTKGTDYDLAPPAAKRVPVVRTIYAEADGVALPDPDPADQTKREYGWMTAHRYTPDRPVSYPFKGWKSLE